MVWVQCMYLSINQQTNKQTNKQNKTKQNKTKQNKTKQNKTKQNKTNKQNKQIKQTTKTKQNKTKQNKQNKQNKEMNENIRTKEIIEKTERQKGKPKRNKASQPKQTSAIQLFPLFQTTRPFESSSRSRCYGSPVPSLPSHRSNAYRSLYLGFWETLLGGTLLGQIIIINHQPRDFPEIFRKSPFQKAT